MSKSAILTIHLVILSETLDPRDTCWVMEALNEVLLVFEYS